MVVDLHVTCACIMFQVSFSGGRHGGFEKCDKCDFPVVGKVYIIMVEKEKKNVTSMTLRWSATCYINNVGSYYIEKYNTG